MPTSGISTLTRQRVLTEVKRELELQSIEARVISQSDHNINAPLVGGERHFGWGANNVHFKCATLEADTVDCDGDSVPMIIHITQTAMMIAVNCVMGGHIHSFHLEVEFA